jgi:hypothetical protein
MENVSFHCVASFDANEGCVGAFHGSVYMALDRKNIVVRIEMRKRKAVYFV